MIFSLAAENAPLAAQKLVDIGPLPLTNSMLTGIITAAFVLGLLGLAAHRSQIRPVSKLAFYVESMVELLYGMIAESFGDRKKASKHFPLLITLFVFILACNLSGLLPGVDSITYSANGEPVSLFRSFTTDLNSTLAMAIISLTVVHVYAIKELGVMGRLKHYFTNKPWNPMNLFIGLNEVFGEVLRLVTLSLRLFGVIYGGEALLVAIAQISGNFAWAATLPIMFLEIFFSFVQAYLFMMLTTTYIVMATSHPEETAEHEPQPANSRRRLGKKVAVSGA